MSRQRMSRQSKSCMQKEQDNQKYDQNGNHKQKNDNRKQKHKQKQGKLEEIIYVSWEESERGWGTRPDGCSLHLTQKDYAAYLNRYWATMPQEVPDEYSRPAGRPVIAYARKPLYNRIKREGDYGLRLYESEDALVKSNDLIYGKDRSGWVPLSK